MLDHYHTIVHANSPQALSLARARRGLGTVLILDPTDGTPDQPAGLLGIHVIRKAAIAGLRLRSFKGQTETVVDVQATATGDMKLPQRFVITSVLLADGRRFGLDFLIDQSRSYRFGQGREAGPPST